MSLRADVRRNGLEAGIVILAVLLFAAIVIIVILTVLSVVLRSKIKNGFNPISTHNPNTLGEYTYSRYCNIHSLSVYYSKYIIPSCFTMIYIIL